MPEQYTSHIPPSEKINKTEPNEQIPQTKETQEIHKKNIPLSEVVGYIETLVANAYIKLNSQIDQDLILLKLNSLNQETNKEKNTETQIVPNEYIRLQILNIMKSFNSGKTWKNIIQEIKETLKDNEIILHNDLIILSKWKAFFEELNNPLQSLYQQHTSKMNFEENINDLSNNRGDDVKRSEILQTLIEDKILNWKPTNLEHDINSQSAEVNRSVIELICNGLDANSNPTKTVDIKINTDGYTVCDNGAGMNQYIILEKLLLPKVSGKSGKDTIGRFGVGFYTALSHIKTQTDEVKITTNNGIQTFVIRFFKDEHTDEILINIETIENSPTQNNKELQQGTKIEVKCKDFDSQNANELCKELLSFNSNGKIIINNETINNDPNITIHTFENTKIKYSNEVSQTGKVFLLVNGVTIESFNISGDDILKTLALDFPLTCKIPESRAELEIDEVAINSIKEMIAKTFELKLPQQQLIQILNSLCPVLETLQNKRGSSNKNDDLLNYLKTKFEEEQKKQFLETQETQTFLPNSPEFKILNIPNATYIDKRLVSTDFEKIKSFERCKNFESKMGYKLFLADFKEDATDFFIEYDKNIILDKAVYEQHKDCPVALNVFFSKLDNTGLNLTEKERGQFVFEEEKKKEHTTSNDSLNSSNIIEPQNINLELPSQEQAPPKPPVPTRSLEIKQPQIEEISIPIPPNTEVTIPTQETETVTLENIENKETSDFTISIEDIQNLYKHSYAQFFNDFGEIENLYTLLNTESDEKIKQIILDRFLKLIEVQKKRENTYRSIEELEEEFNIIKNSLLNYNNYTNFEDSLDLELEKYRQETGKFFIYNSLFFKGYINIYKIIEDITNLGKTIKQNPELLQICLNYVDFVNVKCQSAIIEPHTIIKIINENYNIPNLLQEFENYTEETILKFFDLLERMQYDDNRFMIRTFYEKKNVTKNIDKKEIACRLKEIFLLKIATKNKREQEHIIFNLISRPNYNQYSPIEFAILEEYENIPPEVRGYLMYIVDGGDLLDEKSYAENNIELENYEADIPLTTLVCAKKQNNEYFKNYQERTKEHPEHIFKFSEDSQAGVDTSKAMREILHSSENQIVNDGYLWIREILQNSLDAIKKSAQDGVEQISQRQKKVDIKTYLRSQKNSQNSDLVIEVSDPVGMNINTIINYLLIPNESSKEDDPDATGKFGQGFFTIFNDAKEVLIKTSIGDMRVQYLKITPLKTPSGQLINFKIEMTEKFEEFKGTTIQKIVDTDMPQIESAFCKNAVISYGGLIDRNEIELNFGTTEINKPRTVLAKTQINGVGTLKIFDANENAMTQSGLFIKKLEEEIFSFIPSNIRDELIKNGIVLDIPAKIGLIKSRADIAKKKDVLPILTKEIPNLALKAYLELVKLGKVEFKNLSYDYFESPVSRITDPKIKMDAEEIITGKVLEDYSKYKDQNNLTQLLTLLPIFEFDNESEKISLKELANKLEQNKDADISKLPEYIQKLIRHSQQEQVFLQENIKIAQTIYESKTTSIIKDRSLPQDQESKQKSNVHYAHYYLAQEILNGIYSSEVEPRYYLNLDNSKAHAMQNSNSIAFNLEYIQNILPKLQEMIQNQTPPTKKLVMEFLQEIITTTTHERQHNLEGTEENNSTHNDEFFKGQRQILAQLIKNKDFNITKILNAIYQKFNPPTLLTPKELFGL